MQLTEEQGKAVETLMNFLVQSEQTCMALKGHAGTGKTTIIQHLQQAYNKHLELYKLVDPKFTARDWAFTATTNKATEYLEQAIGEDVQTVHALFNINVRTDYKTGENYSFRLKNLEPVQNKIIVVDESSYIDQHLLNLINRSIKNCKIIYVGDPSQLTPVKSDHIPVFEQDYPEAVLTQVMRQDKNHPIQNICTELRETIQTLCGLPKIKLCAEIQHVDKVTFEQQLMQEFSRPKWKQQESKVLAWRNKTVAYYNNLIFTHYNQRSEFKQGDYVLNNHHVEGIKSDAECYIQEITPAIRQGTHGFKVKLSAQSLYYFMPENLSDRAKAIKSAQKAEDQERMQDIVERWVDLRPAYACTINKAQGSTYDKVFIDLGDLSKCKDVLQFARLLYVAISRAKYQVIFTGDIA